MFIIPVTRMELSLIHISFKDRPAGTLRQTLLLLAIVRLMLPDVLLPATTALGTIEPDGSCLLYTSSSTAAA